MDRSYLASINQNNANGYNEGKKVKDDTVASVIKKVNISDVKEYFMRGVEATPQLFEK